HRLVTLSRGSEGSEALFECFAVVRTFCLFSLGRFIHSEEVQSVLWVVLRQGQGETVHHSTSYSSVVAVDLDSSTPPPRVPSAPAVSHQLSR
ncbi:hypothetical protein KUCAC02_000487, partial [Chaenocephalus aceratus]